jgi:hypothetical protein
MLSRTVWKLRFHSLPIRTFSSAKAKTIDSSENTFFEKYRKRIDESLSKEPLLESKVTSTGATTQLQEELEPKSAPFEAKETSKKSEALTVEEMDSKPFSLYLNSILNIDMIKDLSSIEISKIWNAFFSQKEGSLSASLTGAIYAQLRVRSILYPMVLNLLKLIYQFILPLSRETGFEFYLIQFDDQIQSVLFTSLTDYQMLGPEGAKPHLTLTHYDDFAKSKDLVLMKVNPGL